MRWKLIKNERKLIYCIYIKDEQTSVNLFLDTNNAYKNVIDMTEMRMKPLKAWPIPETLVIRKPRSFDEFNL